MRRHYLIEKRFKSITDQGLFALTLSKQPNGKTINAEIQRLWAELLGRSIRTAPDWLLETCSMLLRIRRLEIKADEV